MYSSGDARNLVRYGDKHFFDADVYVCVCSTLSQKVLKMYSWKML